MAAGDRRPSLEALMPDVFAELTKTLPPQARARLYQDTLHLTPEAYLGFTPLLERSLEPWLE